MHTHTAGTPRSALMPACCALHFSAQESLAPRLPPSCPLFPCTRRNRPSQQRGGQPLGRRRGDVCRAPGAPAQAFAHAPSRWGAPDARLWRLRAMQVARLMAVWSAAAAAARRLHPNRLRSPDACPRSSTRVRSRSSPPVPTAQAIVITAGRLCSSSSQGKALHGLASSSSRQRRHGRRRAAGVCGQQHCGAARLAGCRRHRGRLLWPSQRQDAGAAVVRRGRGPVTTRPKQRARVALHGPLSLPCRCIRCCPHPAVRHPPTLPQGGGGGGRDAALPGGRPPAAGSCGAQRAAAQCPGADAVRGGAGGEGLPCRQGQVQCWRADGNQRAAAESALPHAP